MNEYTTIEASARSHDPNGNLVDDVSRLFEYDYRNRLVGVSQKASGTPVARYLYHADNRRAKKVVFSESDPQAVDKETTYFYDGWQVVEERNGPGETETTYVWSPTGIDRLVQLERTASHPLGEGTFYTHQNARADVVAITDRAGSVVETLRYDDFGNPDRTSTVGLPYLFQGRRLDPETGLYYFRNRHYDPQTGRFLERDPIWDAQNVGGWYTFAGNGPVSRRDAFGLEGEPVDSNLKDWLRNREVPEDDARNELIRLFLEKNSEAENQEPEESELTRRVREGSMFIAIPDYATYVTVTPVSELTRRVLECSMLIGFRDYGKYYA
jgi:RHS repeat-associated protein